MIFPLTLLFSSNLLIGGCMVESDALVILNEEESTLSLEEAQKLATTLSGET